jgi:hypothetical protein
MAPIRGSACITQGHARREWHKKPKGGKYFQQRRSRLSYKDLKIPEVGGRRTSAKQPIGNINSTLPFFYLHNFKALALRSLGEIMLEAKEILCGAIYCPLHDENNEYDCKRERKPVHCCISLVRVPYRSEQNLELRSQQCLGTSPGKGCRQ